MKPSIEVSMESFALLGFSEEPKDFDVHALLNEALTRLATRLATSPFARSGVRELALERLELGTIPADELLGPRGAERLADELYTALTRRLS